MYGPLKIVHDALGQYGEWWAEYAWACIEIDFIPLHGGDFATQFRSAIVPDTRPNCPTCGHKRNPDDGLLMEMRT